MIRMDGLPLARWPEADRRSWEAAMTPSADPWAPYGSAAGLSEKTLRSYTRVYGIWLAHLAQTGQLLAHETPAERATPARVKGWHEAMVALRRANGTMKLYFMSLHVVLGHIAPDYDTDFILHPGGRSLDQIFPTRGKPSEPHDTLDLLRHVAKLHQAGLAEPPGLRRNKQLRDAAIMAVLYSRAPRVGDLARMRIGDHLRVLDDGKFLVRFPAETGKTPRDLEYLLDPEIAMIVMDYMQIVRPHLRGSANTNMLWMGTTGRPLNDIGVTGVVKRRNRDFIGKAEGPHMARKWLTDTARSRSPAAAFDAAEVMGHSPQTALLHYAQAEDLHAASRYGQTIARLRRETESLAKRAFAQRQPSFVLVLCPCRGLSPVSSPPTNHMDSAGPDRGDRVGTTPEDSDLAP